MDRAAHVCFARVVRTSTCSAMARVVALQCRLLPVSSGRRTFHARSPARLQSRNGRVESLHVRALLVDGRDAEMTVSGLPSPGKMKNGQGLATSGSRCPFLMTRNAEGEVPSAPSRLADASLRFRRKCFSANREIWMWNAVPLRPAILLTAASEPPRNDRSARHYGLSLHYRFRFGHRGNPSAHPH